jgi:hypothetical protein
LTKNVDLKYSPRHEVFKRFGILTSPLVRWS